MAHSSDSCEIVRAFNILEHLHEVVPAMEQIHRILKPGGIAWIQVPDYRWEGAYWDPTHHSFFTPHTMTYFEPGNPHAYYTHAAFRIRSMKVIKHGPFASYIEKHGSGRLLGSINQLLSRSPQCIEWKLEAVKP